MAPRVLHDSLRSFVEEASLALEYEVAQGAEVPYEVVESAGSSAALYCYEPLSGAFIRDQMGVLARLLGFAPAAEALGRVDGLADYLRARGEPRIPPSSGELVEATLRSLLSHVFAGTAEFAYSAERFERAYAELERMVYNGRSEAMVAVRVDGLVLASAEVELGDGLSFVRADALDEAPPDLVDDRGPALLAVLRTETVAGDPPPVALARERFATLLTALRLFDAGSISLGPVVWARADYGPWRLAASGAPNAGSGEGVAVSAAQEDELRAFCSLISRRLPSGDELAWALGRYEMGLERADPFEALTDHLLALRALLEPEGPASGRLATRLAAICALPEDRAVMAERVAHAISLERGVIAGLDPAERRADALAFAVSEALRAVLRDVLCGHLDPNLRAVADAIISGRSSGDPAPATYVDTAETAADTAEMEALSAPA